MRVFKLLYRFFIIQIYRVYNGQFKNKIDNNSDQSNKDYFSI